MAVPSFFLHATADRVPHAVTSAAVVAAAVPAVRR